MSEFIQFVVEEWVLFAALVVVVGLLVYEPLSRRASGVQDVSPLQLPQLMSHESAVVVDVSEAREYDAGHIPGSVNVPLGDLRDGPGKLEKFKGRPVVAVCPNGNRSLKGATMLRRHGFEPVYNLAGGLTAWKKENLPVEKR
jgi:rhodanese-related sulfurtransferase